MGDNVSSRQSRHPKFLGFFCKCYLRTKVTKVGGLRPLIPGSRIENVNEKKGVNYNFLAQF